ncbi:S1 family peptidase [Rhodovarius crocodyli]|nr:serine protease [Rhodovarius crocodyli]
MPRNPLTRWFQPVSGLLMALFLQACAGMPADQARGTPAEHVARDSLLSLRAHGATVGAAVVVRDPATGAVLALTNAHVVRQGGTDMTAHGADGQELGPARILATSARMDLAVLSLPPEARPADAGGAPRTGAAVWAVGPQGLGRALAVGEVERAQLRLRHLGPGFTARLGALRGFSGGPVVGRDGRVLGLTTAMSDAARTTLGALTGMDLEGLAGDEREVFVLSIQEALAEARRLSATGARMAAR